MTSKLEADVMGQTKVKIQLVENVAHDVLRIITEKPGHIIFTPGQAVELSINK